MPPGMPQIELQWRSGWRRLDELAGCRDDWNLGTGNPCASDVPVIWAKKGIEIGPDEDWLNAFGIENSRSTCLARSADDGLTCVQWIESKGGCWREEASVCTCATGQASGSGGCREWHCLAKEVHHQNCWEANWDEAFDTECGAPGYAPWPLGREIGVNYTEFRAILSAENTSAALSSSHADAVNLLRSKQASHWYRFGRHCVAQRKVGDKKEWMPRCDTWRQISSKASSCRCLGSGLCRQWRCEGSTALAAAEVRDFECQEFLGSSCVRWNASVAGPLAQLGECRTCNGTGDCLFACRYISMHRIVEFPVGEVSSWILRLLHAVLHLVWLLPLSLLFGIVLLAGEGPDGEELSYFAFKACCAFPVMVLLMVFAWLVAFYRDYSDVGPLPPIPRWGARAPTEPLAGLFFTFGTALLCGCLAGLPVRRNRWNMVGPVFVVPTVVAFWSLLWSCGFAIAWLPLVLLIGFVLGSVRWFESRAVCPDLASISDLPSEKDSEMLASSCVGKPEPVLS